MLAANNDGVWSPVPAVASIRQMPRLYETPLFLAALAGVRGLQSLRVRRHRRIERELPERIREALARVKTLSGLLPICTRCQKVRDDTGYWSQIETYVREHSDADFSHGICPECSERARKDLGQRGPDDREDPG